MFLWLIIISFAVANNPPTLWTPETLSTSDYEASPVFSPDGQEMYFFRANPSFSAYQLAWARCETGTWVEQPALPFSLAAPVDESDPLMTPDGRGLYYISTRTLDGDVKEDFDIWYVERDAEGVWGTPTRLPWPVNSTGSELLPRLGSNGELIFGSDRPGGLGGQDIYMAHKSVDNRWTIRNLGTPINSAANDYEADMTSDGDHMVVVSDRGGRSHLHLFHLEDQVWLADGLVPAREDVFQVGPLFSPLGDKLLFSQANADQSGEIFLSVLNPSSHESWPPNCQ